MIIDSKNNIEIQIDILDDEARNKLQKIKNLLMEIKEIDNGFSLNNVLEVDEDTVLIISTDLSYKKKNIDFIEKDLKKRIGIKCVLIPRGIRIEKAIKNKINYEKRVEYITETSYTDGQVVNETMIQYK